MSEDELPGNGPASERGAVVLEGIAGSAGYAIGPAIVVDLSRQGVPRRHVSKHVAHDEVERLHRAVERAARELRDAVERTRGRSTRLEESILNAYLLMVEDETLREEVERHINIDYMCAEWALSTAVEEMAAQLRTGGDPYLAERSHDFQFVGDRLQRALSGRSSTFALPADQPPGILVTHDLSPAETVGLTPDRVLGIATEAGTRTSHTAILARALGIPAVVGTAGLLSKVGEGDLVAVDGVHGRVVLSPHPALVQQIEAQALRFRVAAEAREKLRDRPVTTRCGVPIEVRANIELPIEAEAALRQGAQGIGLYRTEFLFVERGEPPSEDEHYETYRRVVEAVAPLPVTLRTFDIGGDKFVSSLPVHTDMNPALGLRAVRLGLARPDLFLTQLRAMIRASAHGPVRIMVPMIASLVELRAVRELLDHALKEVDDKGQPRAAHVPLGMMVEVPSAAVMAEEFAADAEFFSIGTNDLTQYTLAVDRSSPELAYLASFFEPAILRLIRLVIRAGASHDRPVALCGAMAGDQLASLLLVGMGLRELSMEPSAVPAVREVLCKVSLSEAEEAAREALLQLTAADAERCLRDRFGDSLALE